MAIETPKYKIIKSEETFQIRDYTEYVTAEVSAERSFDDAGKKHFAFYLTISLVIIQKSKKWK